MMNDADIEMIEAAQAANAAAATRTNRPFDIERDGDVLEIAVERAVTYFHSVYETVSAVAADYGFAHDEKADAFAYRVAERTKAELDREMREARNG